MPSLKLSQLEKRKPGSAVTKEETCEVYCYCCLTDVGKWFAVVDVKIGFMKSALKLQYQN